MKYLLLSIFYVGLMVSSLVQVAWAKQIPPKPVPYRLVNDYANILNSAQWEALEQKLRAYEDSTSTQIVVVIERSLEDDALDW